MYTLLLMSGTRVACTYPNLSRSQVSRLVLRLLPTLSADTWLKLHTPYSVEVIL